MTVSLTIPRRRTSEQAPSFQSQSSFSQKLLNFSITLAQNSQNNQPTSFAGAGSTIQLVGQRARARITNATSPSASSADIAIYGLDQNLMNQLSVLGIAANSVTANQILVSAGVGTPGGQSSAASAAQSLASGFPVVFGGTIWFAFGDYNNMPDVPFRITAQSGLYNAIASATPSSYSGSVDIASLMQNFASKLGVAFENNGVSLQVSNPYLPGTVLQQVYRLAEHANIYAQLVDGGTKLAIWPVGGSRSSQSNVPLISPETGMVGYPTFGPNGYLTVKMLYNPDVIFGGNIKIESSLPQANKTWTVYQLDLALDSLFPDGEWLGTAQCLPQGQTTPVPAAPVTG